MLQFEETPCVAKTRNYQKKGNEGRGSFAGDIASGNADRSKGSTDKSNTNYNHTNAP